MPHTKDNKYKGPLLLYVYDCVFAILFQIAKKLIEQMLSKCVAPQKTHLILGLHLLLPTLTCTVCGVYCYLLSHTTPKHTLIVKW